MQSIVVKKTPL